MTPVEQITSLYIGYFGRAPDPVGLNYWVGRYNDGFSLAEIAESFSVQPEAQALYPYLANPNVATPSTFIQQVYMNLFNRMPDAEGEAYWTAQLNSGTDIGDFILDVISGAVTDPDQQIIENKVEVGVDFATKAANQPNFVYNEAAATAAVEVIDGVNETDASVDAAIAETDAFIAGNGGAIGATFTLTAGDDFADVAGSVRAGGAIPSDFRFTSGNEAVSTTAANLAAGDVLADGSTSDRDQLNISAAGAGSFGFAPTSVSNIEDINVTASAGADGTIALTNFTGVRNVTVTGAIAVGGAALTAFAASGVSAINTSAVTGGAFSISDATADQAVTVTTGSLGDTVLLGDGNNDIDTGAGDDFVTVGEGANTISTGAGADNVTATDGNNTIDVGAGADTVAVGDGNNTITLGNGANTLTAGGGNNVVTSLEANDTLTFGDGDNIINSGEGADTITAGDGDNTILSGDGDDVITVGNGNNAITAGAGQDDITVGTGDNVITIGGTDSGLTTATADVITGFAAGGDNSLALGTAGSATNYVEIGGGVASVEAAIAAETAAGTFDGTIQYVLVDGGADSYLLIDSDLDGAADSAVTLVGVTAADFAFDNIVA